MFCKCGGDKFYVVKVHREKRYLEDKKKWVYSEDHDTRLILCTECKRLFYSETVIVCEVKQKPDPEPGIFD